MKTHRVTQALLLIAALAAAALGGCVPRVAAPRIPAFKGVPGAPYGEEIVVPETASPMLREAPEGIKPSELVK
ncbi:MAG: hypothetical protein WCP22_07290 [Chlamydiota bacterium]